MLLFSSTCRISVTAGEAEWLTHPWWSMPRIGYRFTAAVTVDESARRRPTPTEPPDSGLRPSVAVPPFGNLSDDAEQEYFADGITEDIIIALSRFRWVFVIARNSSFTFKGKDIDVKEVARKLDARYVLEGSVRKSGRQVRITAQLIDAGSISSGLIVTMSTWGKSSRSRTGSPNKSQARSSQSCSRPSPLSPRNDVARET